MCVRMLVTTALALNLGVQTIAAGPEEAVVAEPEYLPVEDLLATSARVFIGIEPEDPFGELTGRGYPFVSVRGVFPYRQQLQRFCEASGCTPEEAEGAFHTVDFTLERQQLLGEDHWSRWEACDTARYRDVLSASAGLAPEPLAAAVCDSGITCPLPWRLTGQWRSQAVHPRLERYMLTDDEIAQEMAFLEALGQAEVDLSMPEEAAEQIMEFVPVAWQDVITVEWIVERLTAAADDWLFRYLDFDVTPGATYRYRVRLELLNPVRGQSVRTDDGEVVISEGGTRMTPWSTLTEPVFIQELTQIFGVGHTPPRVRLFQYDLPYGTTVAGELSLVPGQRIAGVATVRVINGVDGEAALQEYSFQTGAELVDVVALPELPRELHPDLEAAAEDPVMEEQRGWLIVHRNQGLQAVEIDRNSAGLQQQERLLELQSEYFGVRP